MNREISVVLNTNDAELVDKVKSGDKSGFNKIILKYQKQVYRFAKRLLNEHDDADDVTQEVFIRLYNSIGDFRGESKLSTYIYRITYNLCLNHIKKKNRFQKIHVNIEQENNLISGNNSNPEYDFAEKEKQKLIRKAYDSLPEKQKAVFNLRFYENLSYEEISKITGKSVGGIKANYFHAFKKIELKIKNSKYYNSDE
jgi:RNA polymerase sigma-70 factor (ECF subfamily)